MEKKVRKHKKLWLLLPAVILVILVAGIWYVNDYYHSDKVEAYLTGSDKVTVSEIKDGLYFDGTGEDVAMIFYPGAKVEYTAYATLMFQLAQKGVDCFLIKMPCNLAFLGQSKADTIMKDYEYDRWYLAGHSLGGAMAASYASGHLEELDGLILLAAYPTKSLKSEGFSVLTVYGSEDQVVNRKKLESGRELMPKDYKELCIEGGNHAWFGNYGEQKGDGTAAVSHEEQQRQTVEAIVELVF